MLYLGNCVVFVVHFIKTDKNNNQKVEEQHLLQPSWQPIFPASSFSTPVQEPVRTERYVCKDIHIPPLIIQNVKPEFETHFKIQKEGFEDDTGGYLSDHRQMSIPEGLDVGWENILLNGLHLN